MSVKLTKWRRVSPLFYALLVALLVLWWLSHAGPQVVLNLGKLIGTITASPNLGPWLEDIKANYQFFVFLFTIFIVCMGLMRWVGKRLWYQAQISRRKDLKLPVALLFSSDTAAFNYASLFKDGLIGLALVSWYSVFLVISPGAADDDDVLQRLPTGMFFPVAMLAVSFLQVFLGNIFTRQHFGTLTSSPNLIMSSTLLIGVVVISLLIEIFLLLEGQSPALPVQIIITVIMCLSYSYALGVSEGLKAADPESTYPLVRIEVIQGTAFEEAWLYERTDSDYRIVTKSGSNHILPASNVKEIRGL